MDKKIEIRAATQPIRLEGRTLYGTAVPYNSNSLDIGGFQERFLPGSVTDTIKSGLIEAWTYHDRTKPLGSQAGGSLRLKEDETGLHYEIDLPDTSYANDLRAMMSDGRKDIGGTSFGFFPEKDNWKRENGTNIREVVKAHLDHISPVVTPAYPATSAALRSAHEASGIDSMDAYGVDLDRLTGIFVAVQKGLALEDSEMDVARLAIRQLRKIRIARPKLKEAEILAAKILL
jgi:HK97 family phage prohead protease